MQDRFDYRTYWSLLSRIGATHRVAQFADFYDGDVEEPFCILRHDVDYSPSDALRLAEQEAERGVRSTYFLLAGSDYYNLLAPEHAHVPRTLAEMGHEVGLHYDINTLRPFARDEWPGALRAQAALLSELATTPVVSIAMHQPALNGADPFGDSLGLVNASAGRFTADMAYVSDSCRAWRDSTWAMLCNGTFPARLHLCLHPVNWSETDSDRTAIFRRIHDDAVARITAAGEDLLRKVDSHSGVREHRAREGHE